VQKVNARIFTGVENEKIIPVDTQPEYKAPKYGAKMSLYSKQIELLSYLEKLQRKTGELKFRFLCRCECESTFPTRSPYPSWKVHHFTTLDQVRSWIDDHRDHECFVSVQTEGLRAKSEKKSAQNKKPARRRLDIKEKLKALAEGTPYETEADAAIQKIRELENRYADQESTRVVSPSEVDGTLEERVPPSDEEGTA
jgi:hypothetical protein